MREKLIELVNAVLLYLPWGEVTPHTAADIADRIIDSGICDESKWIPVTERLPSDNGKYLCHIFDSSLNNLQFIAMVYYDRGNFVTQSSCVTDCVTHWMPLPEPPKGE